MVLSTSAMAARLARKLSRPPNTWFAERYIWVSVGRAKTNAMVRPTTTASCDLNARRFKLLDEMRVASARHFESERASEHACVPHMRNVCEREIIKVCKASGAWVFCGKQFTPLSLVQSWLPCHLLVKMANYQTNKLPYTMGSVHCICAWILY